MSDTMRAEFEAWAIKEGYPIGRMQDGETYNDPRVHCEWWSWQAAQSQPAPMKLPKLPEPDTTHYAQWAGDRIKYHSVDQIIEFANARVTAALAAAQKGKS